MVNLEQPKLALALSEPRGGEPPPSIKQFPHFQPVDLINMTSLTCSRSPGPAGGGGYSRQILVGTLCAAARCKMGGSGSSGSVKVLGSG